MTDTCDTYDGVEQDDTEQQEKAVKLQARLAILEAMRKSANYRAGYADGQAQARKEVDRLIQELAILRENLHEGVLSYKALKAENQALRDIISNSC